LKTFKDTAGRTWSLSLTIGSAKKIRDLLEIDLFGDDISTIVTDLASDPVRLAGVLWVLVSDEAAAKDINEDDFFGAFSGDVIEAATDLFLEELVQLYPEKKRVILHKILEKIRSAELRILEQAQAMVESDRLDKFIEEKIREVEKDFDDKTSGTVSTQ